MDKFERRSAEALKVVPPQGAAGRRTERGVMPNMLIIGAQKSGTTALYHYLRQHPDVFMSPVKEPNFFAFENTPVRFYDADGRLSPITATAVKDLDAYLELFKEWDGQKAIGEASPHYLYLKGTAQRIHRHIPNVKLIAILRNPIDRAYSAYLHARRANREPLSNFFDALLQEESRIRSSHGYIYHYTRAGFYYQQLVEYYETFSCDQLRVVIYDDFEKNPGSVLRDLYKFLEIDDAFASDVSQRHNKSGLPKNVILHQLYRYVGTRRGLYRHIPDTLRTMLPTGAIREITAKMSGHNLYKPPLDGKCLDHLKRTFEDDIRNLQTLLGRDLSSWLR